jgi:hypothetical protein
MWGISGRGGFLLLNVGEEVLVKKNACKGLIGLIL